MSVKYDWPRLKDEFLNNEDYPAVQTWLREVKGLTDTELASGNVRERTWGWSTARVQHQHNLRKKQEEQRVEILEALTPLLIEAKAEIIMGYLDELKFGRKVSSYDRKSKKYYEHREPLSMRDRSHILTKIKTELGEPAVITKQNTDDGGHGESLMEAVLLAYGIKDKDGRLLIGHEPTKPTDSQG